MAEKLPQEMTSFDTNVLFFAFTADHPEHLAMKAFLAGYSRADNVVICAFVLVELYRLLRNPVLLKNPLGPKEASTLACGRVFSR